MTKRESGSAVNAAAGRLRAVVLAAPDGAYLGSDEVLQTLLGVSRPTMRQAALHLEREGLLLVRRGNNGGYFGTRPDVGFIADAVSNYLETVRADLEDLTSIASLLWVEAVRKAACRDDAEVRRQAIVLQQRLSALGEDAGFTELHALDMAIQRVVFDHVESPYVELIFTINANFARRHISETRAAKDMTAAHREFAVLWREAKHLELDGLSKHDPDLATLGARRARDLYSQRIWL